ncbi:hypothetical protein UlMin_030629 [Ulmus minor]
MTMEDSRKILPSEYYPSWVGKKGVWIKLPIQLANLIETTIKEGFKHHHAESDYLMLVYWISKTKSTIPPNATHRVHVGALILKDDKESGRLRGTAVWKIPTGVVEEGEDIFEAVVREVKEETGIDTKFMEILAFKQSLKSFFNKSDLFFLCILYFILYLPTRYKDSICLENPTSLLKKKRVLCDTLFVFNNEIDFFQKEY